MQPACRVRVGSSHSTHHCVASQCLLFVGIFFRARHVDRTLSTATINQELSTFPGCLADMTSRARPPSDWNRFSTWSLVVLGADRLSFNYYHLPGDFAYQTLQSCEAHNLLYITAGTDEKYQKAFIWPLSTLLRSELQIGLLRSSYLITRFYNVILLIHVCTAPGSGNRSGALENFYNNNNKTEINEVLVFS